jgi:hypothetical protein
MWKAALAGAVALATAGTVLGTTAAQANETGFIQQHPGQVVISAAHVARLRAALQLTVEQERHWPAVEAVLYSMRRHVAGQRGPVILVDANGARRVMSAAMPLFHSLDQRQRSIALQLVNSMGLSVFAAL